MPEYDVLISVPKVVFTRRSWGWWTRLCAWIKRKELPVFGDFDLRTVQGTIIDPVQLRAVKGSDLNMFDRAFIYAEEPLSIEVGEEPSDA